MSAYLEYWVAATDLPKLAKAEIGYVSNNLQRIGGTVNILILFSDMHRLRKAGVALTTFEDGSPEGVCMINIIRAGLKNGKWRRRTVRRMALDAMNHITVEAIVRIVVNLYERGLDIEICLLIVKDAGIEAPFMREIDARLAKRGSTT